MATAENELQRILRTAIQREIDAFSMYSNAAAVVETAHIRDLLNDLAKQEQGHRARLEAFLAGDMAKTLSKRQAKKIVDLKITDYLVEEPLGPDADFQNVLIVAGKREKASHDLYESLAEVAEDADAAKLFAFLAAEELTHKRRVEVLYDEIVYKEN